MITGQHEESVPKEERDPQVIDRVNEIADGNLKCKVVPVDYEVEFNKACSLYPTVRPAMIGMRHDGGPIFALVANGKLLCDIGITVYY